ncbi:carbonic anhydrase 2-like [Liolophura sinensis]|uniref:carbonic anhydrase 2-like n=1 Tax=Liolophura sinensis TaxID=3198878 RepID=UPI0031595D9D
MERLAEVILFPCLLTVCCLPSMVYTAGGGGGWSYSSSAANGPANWHTVSANCGGSSQSPINIETDKAKFDSNLNNFDLQKFGSSNGLTSSYLKNNGHTVQVDLPGSDYLVKGGGLPKTYKLVQFHFHWGATDSEGSEHTVNSNSYPMEVHFVTFANSYGDISTALGHPDGLAVLGFFFEIGSADNTNWNPIVNLLDNVRYADTNVSLPTNFNLDSLLPSDKQVYYRYSGSLTTPTCNEVVTWTVFKQTIKISAGQMAAFRRVFQNIEGLSNVTMAGNFRPLQSLGSREVYTSSGHVQSVTYSVVTACVLSVIFSMKYKIF